MTKFHTPKPVAWFVVTEDRYQLVEHISLTEPQGTTFNDKPIRFVTALRPTEDKYLELTGPRP